MEDVGIFYGHLVHFTVFCYILWTFGIVPVNLVYFSPVLVFCIKKNLATLRRCCCSLSFHLWMSRLRLARCAMEQKVIDHVVVQCKHKS
jgi:hypothetical protein